MCDQSAFYGVINIYISIPGKCDVFAVMGDVDSDENKGDGIHT